MAEKNHLTIEYIFSFDDGHKATFLIKLDSGTLRYVSEKNDHPPEWARLEYEQCPNCTLRKEETPYCPVAKNLNHIIPSFSEVKSFDTVLVLVKTDERNFAKKTSIQRGLSSMLGIYMVTTGCPVLSKLKPMVRHHLPFATVEETIFRSASTYLLGQYFKYKKGQIADLDLAGLAKIYEEIQTVNIALADRLRAIPAKDANLNALVVLDVFAKEMPYSVESSLKDLEYLFSDEIE